jgi:hypothetical protein
MDDNNKFLIMKLFGGILVIGIILILISIFIVEISAGTFNLTLLIILLPAILIIAILIFRINQIGEGVKSGVPLDDELSTRIKERAGYYTYISTMYFVLGLMWYNIFIVEYITVPQIPMNYLIFGILIFMVIAFALTSMILNRKGLL